MTPRSMTHRLSIYYNAAVLAGLPDPLGRAVYAANRAYNATVRDPVKLMANARPETAERWRKHWEAGGSLKSLGRFNPAYQPEPEPATRGRRAIAFGGIP